MMRRLPSVRAPRPLEPNGVNVRNPRNIRDLAAVRDYLASLEGQIPPHEYELLDPTFQVYGDTGILTLRYKATMADGQPGPPSKATSVYRRTAGEWRMVHAHWSLVKAQ